MEYTNSYRKGSCLFEDVCDMSFSKDGRVICLTSSDGNIDGKFLVDKSKYFENFRKFRGRPRKKTFHGRRTELGKEPILWAIQKCKIVLVRKCEDDWPILMRLTPDEYNHKPVLATIFTPNVYDGSVPEGRIILARQELINQWSFEVKGSTILA